MANCDVQTRYGGLKKYQNLTRNPFLRFEVSPDKVSGLKTKFYVFNFFCIDFRRERCDPELRGLVGSDRHLLYVNLLLTYLWHLCQVSGLIHAVKRIMDQPNVHLNKDPPFFGTPCSSDRSPEYPWVSGRCSKSRWTVKGRTQGSSPLGCSGYSVSQNLTLGTPPTPWD